MFAKSKRKSDPFSTLLCEMAANLHETSQQLTKEEDLLALATIVKAFETKGDTLVHDLIVELNHAFITPIEREDILKLATHIDDVLDGIEHCTAMFDIYSGVQVTDYMRQFFDVIYACTSEIVTSVGFISAKKLSDIRPHAIRLKELETKGDELLHDSLKELFQQEKDAIKIIQYKEMYETLETVTDSCQQVANTLETIVMNNA